MIRFSLEKCLLEMRLIVNGQVINVRRETGVVDLLYVARATVGLIVDLAADSNCEPATNR